MFKNDFRCLNILEFYIFFFKLENYKSKLELKKIILWLFQNDLVSTLFQLRFQQNKAKERSTELSFFDIYKE